mgnify:CR=1 FL=1
MSGKRPIKIALFSEVLKEHLDGVTNTLYQIIDRIPKKRFEYLFITSYPPSENVKLPFPVVVVPKVAFPTNPDYPISLPFFNSQLREALDDFQPDIIHLTTPFTLGNYALAYGQEQGIPVLATYHTHFISYIEYYFRYLPFFSRLLDRGGRRYMNWFYNKCDLVYVPTESIMDELLDCGIERRRMVIWGRGIDTTLFSPDNRDPVFMDKLCGAATRRVLFVSRLVWEKELKTLAAVYDLLTETHPDVRFVVTGDGPRRRELERLMPDAVFTGKLVKKELAKVYASSDVFIFPSITETFGNVVLEAMASGLTPVVAAQGGPKGIVKDGLTGFHATPKDPNDFHQKIARILDDPKKAAVMSRRAAEYAHRQQWDTLCEDMFSSYERIAGRFAPATAPEKAHEIAV